MRNTNVKHVALGGVLAAVALIIMCMGGLIPLATFVCPMLCILILHIIVHLCGMRIGWAWCVSVAILSVLLGPDKEATAVFLLLGYYPMLKPFLDKFKLQLLWKLVIFNISVTVLYAVILRLLGLESISAEYQQLSVIGLALVLLLSNITFLILDRLLTILTKRIQRNRG